MGYGEVGGGGSVRWQMVHGNSGTGSGGGSGYDPDPPANTGKFIVKVDRGTGPPTIVQCPIQEMNHHQIQIVWVPASTVADDATPAVLQTALDQELEKQRQELRTRGDALGQQDASSSKY
jgi:hypothetical protein